MLHFKMQKCVFIVALKNCGIVFIAADSLVIALCDFIAADSQISLLLILLPQIRRLAGS